MSNLAVKNLPSSATNTESWSNPCLAGRPWLLLTLGERDSEINGLDARERNSHRRAFVRLGRNFQFAVGVADNLRGDR